MRGTDGSARIFPVETKFQKLARREGGIPREKAIAEASAEIEEIKPDFNDWLAKELESLNRIINQARSGKAGPDWPQLANHHCRQMRDAGSTMGFILLTFIADSLCNVLDKIGAGAEYNMQAVTCHIDALFLARQPTYRHMPPDEVPELTNGLRQIAHRITTSPSGAAFRQKTPMLRRFWKSPAESG